MTRIPIARQGFRVAVGAAVVAALLTSPASASQDATITVNTSADELNADGDCSLREAVAAANGDGNVDQCLDATTTGTDTILVPPGLSPYTLSIVGAGENANAQGDLDFTDTGDTTVLRSSTGSAQSTFIQAGTAGADAETPNGVDRVLHVLAGVTVTISNLTIRNGNETGGGGGGGVAVEGTGASVTLEDSVVSNNGTTSSGGGVAVASDGTATVTRSEISGNRSFLGGAGVLTGSGTATLNSSTVSGNRANGFGGGILASTGTVILAGATVATNVANADSSGTESGGGISQGAGMVFSIGTIFADNSVGAGSASPDCFAGGIHSFGYNVIENATGCTGTIASDKTGVDPQLQALAPNPPGTTRTHALPTTSVAKDLWPTGECTASASKYDAQPTDQRGVARPQGSACDSGAFELQGGASSSTTVTVPPGVCKGRQATHTGTSGNDSITATNAADVIAGLGGNDVIKGLGGNDLVCGGDGNDKIAGGGGNDKLLGDAGNDKIKGGGGNDKMKGAAGTDTCSGGGGTDKAGKCEKGSGVP